MMKPTRRKPERLTKAQEFDRKVAMLVEMVMRKAQPTVARKSKP